MELAKAVRALGGDIADVLRADAREELARRGLVELHRRRVLGLIPHTKVTLTAVGESWRAGSYEREERIEETLRADRAGSSLVPQAAGLGGLVLLLDPAPLAELDEALRRLRDGDEGWDGAGGATAGAGSGDDLDLSGLDGLDLGILDALGDLGTTFDGAFDGAFDSAVDAGSGGDGGGGDGGGS